MKDLEKHNLSEMTLIAVEAALMSGEILAQGFGTNFQIQSKEGIHNLVTEYDLASEKKIIAFIKERFPDHSFLAEEGGGSPPKPDQIQWIIDPLDGTVNFAHSIPMFAVSIAAQKNQETLFGVVYHPLLHELFVAEKGKGAFLNGKRLEVTEIKNLNEAFIATGFPYDVAENTEACTRPLINLLKMGLPIRRIGVASIDLAYVASGRFDAFFEFSLGPWDCVAGNLLIEEAGGKISTWDEKDFDIMSYAPILASNGLLHHELAERLK